MSQPQNFKNHARWRPLFHFTIIPLLLVNLGLAIAYTVKHYQRHVHLGPWWIVMSIVLFLIAEDHRNSALAAQDRIIRLEERLRLTALGVSHTTVYALNERQLIGLRFASDSEVPVLAERALQEKLTEKQIKASIQSWRPDHCRI
jgi:Family of unknown function (DUF6526)